MVVAALSLVLSSFLTLPTQIVGGGGTYQPLPPRAYQPALMDPGLHGGRPKFDNDQDGMPGDVTPDGKVIVFYRKVWDGAVFRPALQVAAFDPDLVQQSNDNLTGFFSPVDGEMVGGVTLWGTDFAISDQNETFVLHDSPPTVAGDPCGTCPPLDLEYLPDGSSNGTLTLAMRPLVGHPAKGANPFPSNANGVYDSDGSHRTYELWMVTTHFGITPDSVGCGVPPGTAGIEWNCIGGVWKFNGKGTRYEPILGCRDVTVIVDESVSPHRVSSASASDFEPLLTGSAHVVGVEPSITADGKLLVYHGNGADNDETKGKVTYAYNPTSCSFDGWEAPESITAMHSAENDAFKERYPLARLPIVGPDSNGNDYAYTAADKLNGPYPWVDKDGSFFVSAHTYSFEGPWTATTNSRATRSSMIVCGDVTGGYIKHIDDVALNPTRHGGDMDWPYTGEGSVHDKTRDSQMTTFFSTGLKPSMWEPFFDQGAPVPTMQASLRIPVLPVFVHRTRLYGEVRFEEADGSYILYLACNESFERNSNPDFSSLVDPSRTPDSSGRPDRPVCSLVQGASFPQEVHGVPPSPPDPWHPTSSYLDATALRKGIAASTTLQAHENIGFKGQAILFPVRGAVQVTGLPAYGNRITFQAFVKPMRTWDSQTLKIIKDVGHFELRLNTLGKFVGEVTVMNNGTMKTKTVNSRMAAVSEQPDELDPTAGWRHVAVTFDGDDGGDSVLRLYLDGQHEDSTSWSGTSTFIGATTDLYVGPRLATGSTDAAEAVLVLDEVAISDVVRTVEELRRDAFVAPSPSGFVPWPPEAEADYPLPRGLDPDDVFWPEGVVYDPLKVTLGRALFADPILSSTETVSCTTCHEIAHSFAEEEPLALDVGNDPLPFNTPTVLNAAFGTHKMFDGRAASLEDQIILPLTSGNEMGVQIIDDVLERLSWSVFDLDFHAIYQESATEETLAEVVAMYQRTLNSGASPFDYDDHPGFVAPLDGPPLPQLTSSQKRGRALFFGKARCFGCHRGASFSDDDFHNIHSVGSTGVDGRGGFTGRPTELGMLKTPTLRNVDKTGPYFHDGSKESLEEVVDHYNGGFPPHGAPGIKGILDRSLVPIDLTPGEAADLVAFLKGLSGTDPQ